MLFDRDAGIILHPTSLPGSHGIGDLGPAAERWVDWLAGTRCTVWQVLPLGPTGYGDSPYQSFSAFAGNPYLISPAALLSDGLLSDEDLEAVPPFPAGHVDYGAVIPWKLTVADRAFRRFKAYPPPGSVDAFEEFRTAHAGWLDDYALFMAVKHEQGGGPWTDWPLELRRREPAELDAARRRLGNEVLRHEFRQFLFFRQWDALRRRAHGHGLRIVGDAPIFVAMDSADVWAHPELFELDDELMPTVVAGVPPDYFSETGQLWGNPLYDWEAHAAEGYAWWIERIRHLTTTVDVVRIDHFRGFVDYWEIPAGAPTAVHGRWLDGPGEALFDALSDALGGLPIIAEDLGELHDAVPELRDHLGLPGMKILQFAFDGEPDNPFLPEHYPENCVVYTGTHDNDTTIGWFQTAPAAERRRALAYLGTDGSDIAADLITTAWRSQAALAAAPLQDFLRLGPEARMNTPGVASGNWAWRFAAADLTDELQSDIAALNEATGRN